MPMAPAAALAKYTCVGAPSALLLCKSPNPPLVALFFLSKFFLSLNSFSAVHKCGEILFKAKRPKAGAAADATCATAQQKHFPGA